MPGGGHGTVRVIVESDH